MTASGRPCSRIATPSPSSNHKASSAPASSGARPGWVLGPLGGHQRRAPGVQPGLVGDRRRGPVVGDPGRRYRGSVVVQIGGRGQPVVFDGHLAAPVGAETFQQHGRLPRPGRPPVSGCDVPMTRNVLTQPRHTNPLPQRRGVAVNPAPYPGVAAGKSFISERSWVSPLSSTAPDPAGSPEPAGPVPLTLASGPGRLPPAPSRGRRVTWLTCPWPSAAPWWPGSASRRSGPASCPGTSSAGTPTSRRR